MSVSSFFSAFFEPASSIVIGNLIFFSNHSIKLLVLIGFLWDLQKCNLNLPGISCSGSPLLCLCVKNFCFVIVFKLFVSLNMVWTETDFFIGNFLLFWFVKIDSLSILQVEHWFNQFLLKNRFPWFDGSKKPSKVNLRKTNL